MAVVHFFGSKDRATQFQSQKNKATANGGFIFINYTAFAAAVIFWQKDPPVEEK